MTEEILKRNKGWNNVAQRPLSERFWLKVSAPDDNGCWNWTGATTSYGYGKLRDNYRYVGAHRVSYQLNIGPIPKGTHVLHKCDNPKCVNPDHLFLGDQTINMKDMFAKGRNKNQYSYGAKGYENGKAIPVEGFIDGEWVLFVSQTEGSKVTGAQVSKISMAIHNLRNKAGGVRWRTAIL